MMMAFHAQAIVVSDNAKILILKQITTHTRKEI